MRVYKRPDIYPSITFTEKMFYVRRETDVDVMPADENVLVMHWGRQEPVYQDCQLYVSNSDRRVFGWIASSESSAAAQLAIRIGLAVLYNGRNNTFAAIRPGAVVQVRPCGPYSFTVVFRTSDSITLPVEMKSQLRQYVPKEKWEEEG